MIREDTKIDAFDEFLRRNQDKVFHVISLPGNKGDELIHRGLYKKLKELGIKFYVSVIEKNKLYYLQRFLYTKFNIHSRITTKDDCDFILLQGGGYMNDLSDCCEGCRLLFNISLSSDKPIVVAPHTFYFRRFDFSTFLKRITNKIFLFCREKESFKQLKATELPKNVSIFLSHDTAFYLDISDFSPHINVMKKRHDLISFREDFEGKLSFAEKKSLEKHLQRKGKKVWKMDISMIKSYYDFVRSIGEADRIFTDRLHVAILGSILGKEVFLFPNIYFKNKAVYEYSLKSYPKTHFCENVEECVKILTQQPE